MTTLLISVVCITSINAHAVNLRANDGLVSFFLSNTWNAIPANYFENDGTDTYVLRLKPNSPASFLSVSETQQWQNAMLSEPSPNGVLIYSPWNNYPSFTETGSGSAPGQCVAFVKKVTHNKSGGKVIGTEKWKAGEKVIPSGLPSGQVLNDISSMHAGKAIAYFGKNTQLGTQYPQNAGNAGHVAIFLKYQYDKQFSFPAKITDFWVADENWKGTPYSGNPDRKIRKHLINITNGDNVYDAVAYRFVDVTL